MSSMMTVMSLDQRYPSRMGEGYYAKEGSGPDTQPPPLCNLPT